MPDIFRAPTPAPGRYSRILFFYLALGILLYSGVNSAVETFKSDAVTPLADTAIQPVKHEPVVDTEPTSETLEDAFQGWSLVKAQPNSPHDLDSVDDKQSRPRS